MTSAQFPGFETGGALWFPNLLETDSYMGLPGISAVTTYVVLKLGIDSGMSSDQMSPYMKIGFQYGVPVIVFVAGWWFPSASSLDVVQSDFVAFRRFVCTGSRAILFRWSSPVYLRFRLCGRSSKFHPSWNTMTNLWRRMLFVKRGQIIEVSMFSCCTFLFFLDQRSAPPSLSSLRRADYDNFKKAGTGKPVG